MTYHFDFHVHAASVEEACELKPARVNARRMMATRANDRGARWHGIEGGWEAVRSTIRAGWPDGVAKMNEALSNLGEIQAPRSIRRTRGWREFGDEVDMQRVYTGALDRAWSSVVKAERTGSRNITIACAVGALANMDGRVLFWRGAAVIKLADMLTAAGYHVGILACSAVRDILKAQSGSKGLCTVVVKDPRAPLEVDSVAGVVALAGFFRDVVFTMRCSQDRAIESHFGYTVPLTQEMLPDYPGVILGVETCINADSARAWIAQQVESLQGVPA